MFLISLFLSVPIWVSLHINWKFGRTSGRVHFLNLLVQIIQLKDFFALLTIVSLLFLTYSSEADFLFRIELLAGIVPANNLSLAGTVPANKFLLAGTPKNLKFQKMSLHESTL